MAFAYEHHEDLVHSDPILAIHRRTDFAVLYGYNRHYTLIEATHALCADQLKPNITAEECKRLYAPVGCM